MISNLDGGLVTLWTPVMAFLLRLLYVPPGLTFTNSTFCPHSVFMCFVWISEQTAVISCTALTDWFV
jgi:hypothetical protein